MSQWKEPSDWRLSNRLNSLKHIFMPRFLERCGFVEQEEDLSHSAKGIGIAFVQLSELFAAAKDRLRGASSSLSLSTERVIRERFKAVRYSRLPIAICLSDSPIVSTRDDSAEFTASVLENALTIVNLEAIASGLTLFVIWTVENLHQILTSLERTTQDVSGFDPRPTPQQPQRQTKHHRTSFVRKKEIHSLLLVDTLATSKILNKVDSRRLVNCFETAGDLFSQLSEEDAATLPNVSQRKSREFVALLEVDLTEGIGNEIKVAKSEEDLGELSAEGRGFSPTFEAALKRHRQSGI